MRRRSVRLAVAIATAATVVGIAAPSVPALASGPRVLPQLWHVGVAATLNEPARWQQRIAFTFDNTARAVDLTTGAPRWRTTVPDQGGYHVTLGAPVLYQGAFDASVYIVYGAGDATFAPSDGAVTVSPPAIHTLRGTRVVAGNLSALVSGAYGSGAGPLFLLDFAGPTWFVGFGSPPTPSAPAITQGRAFIGMGSELLAFDPAQPCVPLPIPNPPPYCIASWSMPLPATASQPSGAGPGRVAVSDASGVVSAFAAADGHALWHSRSFHTALAPTAFANGVLYVAGADGLLRAIDAATGAVRWRGAVGGAVSRAATIAGGAVWLATDTGRLVGFAASGCGASTCAPVAVGASGTNAPAAGPPIVANNVAVAAFGHRLVAFATR